MPHVLPLESWLCVWTSPELFKFKFKGDLIRESHLDRRFADSSVPLMTLLHSGTSFVFIWTPPPHPTLLGTLQVESPREPLMFTCLECLTLRPGNPVLLLNGQFSRSPSAGLYLRSGGSFQQTSGFTTTWHAVSFILLCSTMSCTDTVVLDVL